MYIVCIHERNGGQRAAEWVKEKISEMVEYRKISTPTALWGPILGVTAGDHKRRRTVQARHGKVSTLPPPP